MINANMRLYDYYTISNSFDEYGQLTIPSENTAPVGQVKMFISTTSQSIQDNINFKDCNYIGLTQAKVDDTFIIKYKDERLKVLYVNSFGRYYQVYLTAL